MKKKVIIKRPGERPVSTNISDTLENLQKHVGGYIEIFPLATDLVVICNEEGKPLGLPYNCNIIGEDFCGTIIFAGRDKDEELADIPIDFKQFKKMFPDLLK